MNKKNKQTKKNTAKNLNKNIEQQNNSEPQNENKETDARKLTLVLVISGNDSTEVVDLSLAFWQKNFPDCGLMLAGGEYREFAVVEHEAHEDKNINFANILAACAADERVSDIFAVSPVSTFPVQPVTPADMEALKCRAKKLQDKRLVCLKESSELGVVEALKKEGINSPVNYETGLPVVFEKELLAVLFEKFNPQKLPLKVASLYLNFFYKDSESVPVAYRADIYATAVWRKDPNLDIVKQGLEVSKFFLLNSDGYIAAGKLLQKKLQ